MNIIKAERKTVKFCDGVEVDGYMLPDGEFRVGKVGASVAIGYGKDWLGQLGGKQLELLKSFGFSGKTIRVELDTIQGGGAFAQTLSMEDFDALVSFGASQGRREAMRIMSKNPNIEQVKKLEPKTRKNQTCQQIERQIQLRLLNELAGAKAEVSTLAGKIDILTNTELIEIKEWKRWKEAIGQVLCYGKYYPDCGKRIHFFGNAEPHFIELVELHCLEYGIIISWEVS